MTRLRRLFDVLTRRPSPPDDERSVRQRELNGLATQVHDQSVEAHAAARQASAIRREARLGSYRRVRLDR